KLLRIKYDGKRATDPPVPAVVVIVDWPGLRTMAPKVSVVATLLAPSKLRLPPASVTALPSAMRWTLFVPVLSRFKLAPGFTVNAVAPPAGEDAVIVTPVELLMTLMSGIGMFASAPRNVIVGAVALSDTFTLLPILGNP